MRVYGYSCVDDTHFYVEAIRSGDLGTENTPEIYELDIDVITVQGDDNYINICEPIKNYGTYLFNLIEQNFEYE